MNLSPSKLDTFYGCRRLFQYRYITKPFVPPMSKYFLIGNIAHSACEEFHKKSKIAQPLPVGSKVYTTIMGESFKYAFNTNNALLHLDHGIISDDDLFSIKGMLAEYLTYVKRAAFPNTVSLEKSFTVSFDGVKINGRIDRLDQYDDVYYVIDYKTNAKPMSKQEEKDSVQLPTYGLWIKSEKKNVKKIVARYIYLKHVGSGGIHDFEVTEDMIEQAKEKYRFVDSELRKSDCKFPKNSKYKFCFTCEYKRLCRED